MTYATEARNLNREWLGKIVSVRGTFPAFPENGENVVLRSTIVSFTHHSKGVTIRFSTGPDVLVGANSLVIDTQAPRLGKPYVAPPVVVGGKPQKS